MSGDWLALGAVAALAAAAGGRGGSRAEVTWNLTAEGVVATRQIFDRFADVDSFELGNVEWVDPDGLHEDPQDYERDPEWVERYEVMLRSGQPVPPILVIDGMVWDGHHRWTAAKNLGLTSIPVMNMDYQ